MRETPPMRANATPRAPKATPAPRVSRVSQPKAPPEPKAPLKAPPKRNPPRQADTEGNPPPLKASWLIQPTFYETLHNWLANAMPFRWRERARRSGYWRRRAIPVALALVGVILAVLVGNVGISIARQVTQAFASAAGVAQQQATPGSVIISPLNNTAGTPTPGPITYAVGIWTSNTMPTGGSVTVFVRVSKNGAPVPKARVYLQVGGGSRRGPFITDAYGMASLQLNYGGSQGTPVFLTATTTIDGKTYSGTYTFVAY